LILAAKDQPYFNNCIQSLSFSSVTPTQIYRYDCPYLPKIFDTVIRHRIRTVLFDMGDHVRKV